MTIKLLSSKTYDPQGSNYGDCILIDTGDHLVVYDCGCEEHAKQVEEYANKYSYSDIIIVLSHNDADHFDGIPYLIDNGLVSKVYTQLFFKHKDSIMKLLNDGRVTDKSVVERIKKVYDNINSLSEQVELLDALTSNEIVPGVNIVGPTEEYALETIAKAIDSNESNQINAESVINAASIQVAVDFSNSCCLLCGDASFEAIKNNIHEYSVIQLPHHGKPNTAYKIFEEKKGDIDTVYLVSDNTGNTNGGSSGLIHLGKDVRKTTDGEIIYPSSGGFASTSKHPTRTLGFCL